MLDPTDNHRWPDIPARRFFKIGEVSELCAVKPYVLRYWEQEFPELAPKKRRGGVRVYSHDDILLIRQITVLLHHKGYTISGARKLLAEGGDGNLSQGRVQGIIDDLGAIKRLLDGQQGGPDG